MNPALGRLQAYPFERIATLLAGVTGNRDIVIPAESLVRFRLEDDLTVQPAENGSQVAAR